MSGPAYGVASTATSTTGAATRCWLLFVGNGELRQVRASIEGGTGGWKPIVYQVTDVTGIPAYVPLTLQNGIVYSTQGAVVSVTSGVVTPDPTSITDVPLQAIPASEWTNLGGGSWEFVWKPGEGPQTRIASGASLVNQAVCVVMAGVGSTASTCRMNMNCLWAPEGA